MERRLQATWAAWLAAAILTSFAIVGPARGADLSFRLYGDAALGWGTTSTSFSNPGPPISIAVGDNVTLVLNATDGALHTWFIDYDNDGSRSGGEPTSPNFRDQEITWTFVPDRNGTFTYRCRFHPDTMTGQVVILNASAPPAGWPTGPLGQAILLVAVLAAVAGAISIFILWPSRRRRGHEDDSTEP